MTKGDVLDWDEGEFDVVNMTVEDYSVDRVCKPQRPGHVIFPEKRNFTAAVEICRKMRGQISAVDSKRTMDALVKTFNDFPFPTNDIFGNFYFFSLEFVKWHKNKTTKSENGS